METARRFDKCYFLLFSRKEAVSKIRDRIGRVQEIKDYKEVKSEYKPYKECLVVNFDGSCWRGEGASLMNGYPDGKGRWVSFENVG